ncbi:MAG: lysoplasmalogenase [Elusimicrobia bacterium]|nr:lysoplasmalogenase [Elusimicrobiota bacterium]
MNIFCLAVFMGSALTSFYAVEKRRPGLLALAKPLTTLALIGVAGFPPEGFFNGMIAAGLLFSLGGDIALLSDKDKPFLIGLSLFLLAHLCYIVAFLGQARWASFMMPGSLFLGLTALLFVRILWPGLGGLKIPVVVYAAAITTMVTLALGLVPGPLPKQAALCGAAGALLFYLSDANLAWAKFKNNYPRAELVTLSLYWAGQLGIALAASSG